MIPLYVSTHLRPHRPPTEHTTSYTGQEDDVDVALVSSRWRRPLFLSLSLSRSLALSLSRSLSPPSCADNKHENDNNDP